MFVLSGITHSMKLKRKVVCNQCREKFELYHDLRNHVQSEHPDYWAKVKVFVDETKEVINE